MVWRIISLWKTSAEGNVAGAAFCICFVSAEHWNCSHFSSPRALAAITESKMAWKIQIASRNDWGELRLFRIAHSVWAALSDVHFWVKSCLKPGKRPKSGAEQEEWAQRWLWSIFGSVRCLRWWWCCISLKSPKKEPGRGKQNYFHPKKWNFVPYPVLQCSLGVY